MLVHHLVDWYGGDARRVIPGWPQFAVTDVAAPAFCRGPRSIGPAAPPQPPPARPVAPSHRRHHAAPVRAPDPDRRRPAGRAGIRPRPRRGAGDARHLRPGHRRRRVGDAARRSRRRRRRAHRRGAVRRASRRVAIGLDLDPPADGDVPSGRLPRPRPPRRRRRPRHPRRGTTGRGHCARRGLLRLGRRPRIRRPGTRPLSRRRQLPRPGHRRHAGAVRGGDQPSPRRDVVPGSTHRTRRRPHLRCVRQPVRDLRRPAHHGSTARPSTGRGRGGRRGHHARLRLAGAQGAGAAVVAADRAAPARATGDPRAVRRRRRG